MPLTYFVYSFPKSKVSNGEFRGSAEDTRKWIPFNTFSEAENYAKKQCGLHHDQMYGVIKWGDPLHPNGFIESCYGKDLHISDAGTLATLH